MSNADRIMEQVAAMDEANPTVRLSTADTVSSSMRHGTRERTGKMTENQALTEAVFRLIRTLEFVAETAESLPMLWEKSLSSPERKHNEARNTIAGNARATIKAVTDRLAESQTFGR